MFFIDLFLEADKGEKKNLNCELKKQIRFFLFFQSVKII